MKKIITLIFFITSICLALDSTTVITIKPNEPGKIIDDNLFGANMTIGVYTDEKYTGNRQYEFISKTFRGMWDDNLNIPDTLFIEIFKNAGVSILQMETSSAWEGGRAAWQTLVGGGDTVWRDDSLWPNWDTLYSFRTISDIIELCDSLDARLLLNYNDFMDTAYFYTNGADTISVPHYPDTTAIFADFDSLLDYIYGSETGNSKFDRLRMHDRGDTTGFDIEIIWVIGDDMTASAPWTKGWGSSAYNGYNWGDDVLESYDDYESGVTFPRFDGHKERDYISFQKEVSNETHREKTKF